MRRIMISAMGSGSGKTVLSCGLMRAFRRRGKIVAGFKCGPDYIDPMFHTRVLGVPSRNLDLFLQGPAGVRRTLAALPGDLAVLEGAMGFYDGVNGTPEASAWAVAEATDTPVLLVLRPRGQSVTLAAQIRGLMEFRKPSRIAGLFLTDCRPSLAGRLGEILERETGLPVTGCLPPMEEASLESRHLGLVTAAEIRNLEERFDRIADSLEENADLDALWKMAKESAAGSRKANADPDVLQEMAKEPIPDRREEEHSGMRPEAGRGGMSAAQRMSGGLTLRCRIAVAMDEAFSFYYADNLDALRKAGAELVFFSPLQEALLPEADGLYLGGGYPELYIPELSQNRSMRESVARAVRGGMPAVAECGGFLYLQEALRDDGGREYPMAGALPGRGCRTERLQRFGYLTLRAGRDSLLFRAGESIPAHEFHYWDSSAPGEDITAVKPDGRSWNCGYISETLYAAFPHLHWGGELPMAERFAAAAEEYQLRRHE